MRFRFAICLLLLAASCATRPQFAPAEAKWAQAALDDWETICRHNLQIDPRPLPWMILIDEKAAWHVAPNEAWLPKSAWRLRTPLTLDGQPIAVYGVRHDAGDTVRLPNDTRLPVAPFAAAMLSSSGRPFFVAAVPRVFRRDAAAARDPFLETRLLSVISHEILHTRQLPAAARRLADLRREVSLPADLDDNFVQRTYGDDATFQSMVRNEVELLFRAAETTDAAAMRTLAREAIEAMALRRSRYYVAGKSHHAEVEDIFLAMEGIAEWSRFRLEQELHRIPGNDHDILMFLRGKENEWSQDEGLALFLLIDRLVPQWQAQMFEDDFPSPFALLQTALADSDRSAASLHRTTSKCPIIPAS